jgi:uridine kinase
VLRRISRDIRHRGGTLDGVISWYRRDVQPNYPTYTAAYRSSADLIVPTGNGVAGAVRTIAHALRGMTDASGGDTRPPT